MYIKERSVTEKYYFQFKRFQDEKMESAHFPHREVYWQKRFYIDKKW